MAETYAASLDSPVKVRWHGGCERVATRPACLWRPWQAKAQRLLGLVPSTPKLPRASHRCLVCRWAFARAFWAAWWWASQTAPPSAPTPWRCGTAARALWQGTTQVRCVCVAHWLCVCGCVLAGLLPTRAAPLPAHAGGDVVNVLFAPLIGGFALGQAAPNLQYFTQARLRSRWLPVVPATCCRQHYRADPCRPPLAPCLQNRARRRAGASLKSCSASLASTWTPMVRACAAVWARGQGYGCRMRAAATSLAGIGTKSMACPALPLQARP